MEDPVACTDTIEHLYTRYHQRLCRYLERLVNDREAAEDLTQETFIKAMLHAHEVSTASAFRSWLYRIATNTAYDHVRRRRRVEMIPLTDGCTSPAERPSFEILVDDVEPIRTALTRIPPHYRVPLLLSSAGYNYQDIANAMGIKATTIKTRIHRARAQFRDYYAA